MRESPVVCSSAMSLVVPSRRERLEKELTMLQADVASLCSKLQHPTDLLTANGFETSHNTKSTTTTGAADKGKIARLQRALDEAT